MTAMTDGEHDILGAPQTALGPAHAVLVSLKDALDPRGILNPGKLGLPSPFGAPPWP